tara:strand:- start:5 stop:214 length:210 start_codon:yes stop_codon:yes gene_type:complete
MKEKLIELEEKFAHLDHLVEDLNNVIFRQMQKIGELEEMIKHLSGQLKQINDKQGAETTQAIDERPPHY